MLLQAGAQWNCFTGSDGVVCSEVRNRLSQSQSHPCVQSSKSGIRYYQYSGDVVTGISVASPGSGNGSVDAEMLQTHLCMFTIAWNNNPFGLCGPDLEAVLCLSVFPLPLLMFCTALCLPDTLLFVVTFKTLKNILYYIVLFSHAKLTCF